MILRIINGLWNLITSYFLSLASLFFDYLMYLTFDLLLYSGWRLDSKHVLKPLPQNLGACLASSCHNKTHALPYTAEQTALKQGQEQKQPSGIHPHKKEQKLIQHLNARQRCVYMKRENNIENSFFFFSCMYMGLPL